jgi:TonB family protein
LAGAHPSRAQEAASANLPDQFQTSEMIHAAKAQKKERGARSPSIATAPKQNTAPLPEEPPVPEELPPQIVTEEKKAEPSRSTASTPPSQKVPPVSRQATESEESPLVASEEKKSRPKNRPRPDVQPEVASISAPVPMSLSVAQSMAISAPLPQYTYEAKRRNLTGSGVCVMTVDAETGKVTNAMMAPGTGNKFLDKVTTEAFKKWRFKPGTVSQVRVPISYE